MRTQLSDGWTCRPKGALATEAQAVHVPHDAMLWDPREAGAPSGENLGWIRARDYLYERTLEVDHLDEGGRVLLEFEGVYHNATVRINGKVVGTHDYGYTGFTLDVSDAVRVGERNLLEVEALNADQPNSRWYTGTGIYRPVWLWVLPARHVLPHGIRVTTTSINPPAISVEVRTSDGGEAAIELLDGSTILARSTTRGGVAAFSLPAARTWSPASPKLYTCHVQAGDDVRDVRFGIRTVSLSKEEGLLVNGERTILKGGCVHHDNGILGAAGHPTAERRKARILREAGFTAVRCAHNPCSAAFLDACDELGLLVLDEYADMWYIHKTRFDYADKVEQNYVRDLAEMVGKDYNHPSVIMYSIGNEVSETAQGRGIELTRRMTETLHSQDPTRPVTCGVNIFFNFLSSIGLGVYSDKKAERAAKGKGGESGSAFFNRLAGLMGAGFMKAGAMLPACDRLTRDAFAAMDVAGYNYGIRRYRHDLQKYPGRMILGTETFCSDAGRFMNTAANNPRLIGDFVWSAQDYLGEVGIGAWEYRDVAPNLQKSLGWVAAGAGRIDLTGKPLAEMAYLQVAYGQRTVALGVVPVNHTTDTHSPSAWRMSNARESWAWDGCEDRKAHVEVYARAARVRLSLNGTPQGEKPVGADFRVSFDVPYHAGKLVAEALDSTGTVTSTASLRSAGKKTQLFVEAEQGQIAPDGLGFVRLRYADGQGITKPLASGEICVSVDGGELVALGSAAPYNERSYLSHVTDTYFGEALAVVRPSGAGLVTLSATSPHGAAEAQIAVRASDRTESERGA